MRRSRFLPAPLAAAGAIAAALLLAAPAPAKSRTDEALALVPADAAVVGVVRLADLRTSPLSSKLFHDLDQASVDGDAARFLAETRLNPKEDVDVVVFAGSPSLVERGHATGFVAFDGRFDPAAVAAATAARGGIRKSCPGGEYFLLPDKHEASDRPRDPGAVAFVSPRLIVAGPEPAVVEALAAREAGGTGFAGGSGLGQHLSRVEAGASLFTVVDMTRFPKLRAAMSRAEVDGDVNGQPVGALFSAMKTVTLFAGSATVRGDALKLSAIGLTDDEEMRENLRDGLKGLLALWRIAVQEKSPELVKALRKFTVETDRQGVTLSGTLPGDVVRALAAEKEKKHSQR